MAILLILVCSFVYVDVRGCMLFCVCVDCPCGVINDNNYHRTLIGNPTLKVEPTGQRDAFLTRDAMLVRCMLSLCVRPSVCHKPVLYRNGR